MSRIENAVFADLRGWPRRNATLLFRSKLVFQLMRFVAQQLRAAEDAQLEGEQFDQSMFSPARAEPQLRQEPKD